MSYHITTQQLVERATNYWLGPPKDGEVKGPDRRITEFNLLASGFNASTVLLVISAVSMILFAWTTSFVLGAAGLFIRHITEKALSQYERRGPQIPLEDAPEGERITNIFKNLGATPQGEFERGSGFDEWLVWRNKVELPTEAATSAKKTKTSRSRA